MSGFTYTLMIINPMEIIITLFIRYVLNYGFVKKNLLMRIRLGRLTIVLPSDRILKHQYCTRNYQHYSELVRDLLQPEKHDELTMRNHHQCLIGMTPLSEVNYSSNGTERVDGQNNHPKNFGKSKKDKRNKHKKSKSKDQSSGKGNKPFKCHRCGGPNHNAKKCNIPQHLLDMY
jgi:hypothetical protein